MPHNKLSQINIVLPPMLLVLDLKVLLKSPQNSSEGKENWEWKEMFSLCCACLDPDLNFFPIFGDAVAWVRWLEPNSSSFILHTQEEHPAAWEVHCDPSCWIVWLFCSCSELCSHSCLVIPALVTACHWCSFLGCKLVLSSGHTYKLQEGGVEGSWPAKGWFGQPLSYLPSNERFLKSRADG